VPVLAVLLLSSDLRDFGAQRRGWCRCVHDGHFVLCGTICYCDVLIADYLDFLVLVLALQGGEDSAACT
jgi:hypothetical protein